MLREISPIDDEQGVAPQLQRPVRVENEAHDARAAKLARGLGWFSLVLGITEILAPRLVARAAGVGGNSTIIRSMGLREIVSGIGLLTARRQSPWIWARVAGDAIDVVTLGRAANIKRRPDAFRMAAAFTQLVGITALDIHAARSLSTGANRVWQGNETESSIRDYSKRRGFSHSPEQMRGSALSNFKMPRDMITPPALQSYLRLPPAAKIASQ